jgi:hypothetical protein
LTLALLASGTSARAQSTTAAAEALFREGRALMDAGQIGEACERFAASQRLEPTVGALLNLAECRARNQQTATAWALFRRAAAAAERAGDRDRRRTALRRVRELGEQLSYLTVQVAARSRVNGLRVFVGDDELDPALWNRRVPMDPGAYVLRAEAPGHEGWRTRVEVGADRSDISAAIPRLRALPAPPQPLAAQAVVAPPAVMPFSRKVALGLGVAGGAALLTGALLAWRSSAVWDDAAGHCEEQDGTYVCEPEGVKLHDEVGTYATLSRISYGVGAASLIAGAALWWLGSPGRRGEERRPPRAVSLRPWLDGRFVGLVLEARTR